MAVKNPLPARDVLAAQQGGGGGGGGGAATSQEAAPFSGLLLVPPAPAVIPVDSSPILAAGDGKTLWLVHPVVLEQKDQKTPSYELLARSSNTGTWSRASTEFGPYFAGFPQGLSTIGGISGTNPAPAYVFTENCITQFTLADHSLLSSPLPADQVLVAEAGGMGEMFAITRGPRVEATTQAATEPDVPLPTITPLDERATAPATRLATAPAPGPVSLNAWWYRNDEWVRLPPLVDGAVANAMPAKESSLAIAAVCGRLIAFSMDRAMPGVLTARSLEYRGSHSQWSAVVNTQVDIPADAHLMTAVLDQVLYVFWSVNTGKMLSLHGGWVITTKETGEGKGSSADLTMPVQNRLPPLELGAATAQDTWTDVAIGPAENSLAVIRRGAGNALTCQLFSNRGHPIGAAVAVTVKSISHELVVAENVAVLLMAVMIGLSIWQWRQRPVTGVLAANQKIAALHLRALAFVIDLAIPFLIICAIFGFSDYETLFSAWSDAFSNPDELLNAPTLLYTLALYLVLVTLGELFFRRSIGKAILGMQVLLTDGKAPTVAAIVLRNLVRIPEMMPGILIFYVLISDKHQRLGDLLARTIVVAQKAPETPADPDAKQVVQKKQTPADPPRERLR